MAGEFGGKVAVVTGAASGIGLAIARSFVEAGGSVVIADLDAQAAARASGSLERGLSIGCDVGDPAQVDAAVAAAVERFGGLDVMVNNAGVPQSPAPVVECDAEQLERILRVNVIGVFNGIKAATPRLAERGAGGSIVSTASAAGLRGTVMMGLYACSKAAVINLTQTTALELRPLGIRVNCVCPGNIDTPMMDSLKESFEKVALASVEELTAMKQGRMGAPEDIAGAVMALIADRSAFVSGVALPVDNAMSASLF
jgi:galactitol 2-dehydrogenase